METTDTLVCANMDLATRYARNFGTLDRDASLSAAMAGLWEAARKWDGAGDFRALATTVIRCRLKDEHRRTHGRACNAHRRRQGAVREGDTSSLNASPDGEREYIELLDDTNAVRTGSALEYRDDIAALRRGLLRLPQRDRDVLERYYGINRPEQSLDEVARELGITKQRVHQIISKRVGELRHLCANSP